MKLDSRRDLVFLILAGFFVTNAIVAELIGGKLIQVGPFTFSIGIIPWPVVFIITDLINEYYGKQGVKKLSLITCALIIYSFIILFIGMSVNATSFSPVTNEQFIAVFGQSMWIIVGSIVAFLVSQLIDVFVFWFLRDRTGGKYLWLRSTGSTAVSQLIDTFIVLGIAFWLPGKITFENFIILSLTGYTGKLIIAVGLTPVIYLLHNIIDKYLGEKESQKIINESAEKSLHHSVDEGS